jgi:hypothetical protein
VRDMMPPLSRVEDSDLAGGERWSAQSRLRTKVEDLFRSGQEAHEPIAGF